MQMSFVIDRVLGRKFFGKTKTAYQSMLAQKLIAEIRVIYEQEC